MTGSTGDFYKPRVLVVGRSPVNLVVVSRIVERTGLKARSEAPETSLAAFAEVDPAILILDGGPADRDCDGLIEPLREVRLRRTIPLPGIILLSTLGRNATQAPVVSICDMILSKPITVDRLQPAIEALRALGGDFGRRD